MRRNRPTRRSMLQSTAVAGGALLGLDGLGLLNALRPVSADEAKLESKLVRLDPSIEPTVRLLEEAPRERLLEEVAGRVRKGLGYREVLAALLLAGVRNVPPRPTVGFKFHAVLVVHSAHLASLASPDEDRWLPIFWALDYFKNSQGVAQRESGWRMAAVDESKVPPAEHARDEFVAAMDSWDEARADAATAAVVRTLPRSEVFELFARYAARDFRDIGHKTIFVAGAFRTLACIGWHHAEPVLRSLTLALLKYDGENPAKGDAAPDRPWRKNIERAAKLDADRAGGKIDNQATIDLLGVCRSGSPDETSAAVVEMLNSGVSAQSAWDAMLCAAGELLMRRRGIVALHAVTMTNAMHHCFHATTSEETRKRLLLQNAAFLPMFRAGMGNNLADVRIDQLDAERDSDATGDGAVTDIFSSLEGDRLSAARRTLGYLRAGQSAEPLMDAARRLIFLKGTDSHDYKFSAAAMEDYHNLSPAWRDRFLASSMFYFRGTTAKDNALVARTRAALST